MYKIIRMSEWSKQTNHSRDYSSFIPATGWKLITFIQFILACCSETKFEDDWMRLYVKKIFCLQKNDMLNWSFFDYALIAITFHDFYYTFTVEKKSDDIDLTKPEVLNIMKL